MKQYTAGINDTDVRLSRFVQRVAPHLPQSALHKSFRLRRIKVNGKRADADYRLQLNDTIELYINDAFFTSQPRSSFTQQNAAQATPVAFSIVWQNAQIAILHKPLGVLTHPEKGSSSSLLQTFTQHLIQTQEYTPGQETTFAPALCNRLDRGTEGLVIGAKQYAALRDMNALLREGLVQKTYLAVTVGQPPNGTQHAFLSRNRTNNTSLVKHTTFEDAKPIATGIQVVASHGNLCLCEITLITGRTHQIRAHLAFLGYPILGDPKYGNPQINRKLRIKSQALCAWRLQFPAAMPPQNTLVLLAGKQFTAQTNNITSWWQNRTLNNH